MATRKQSAAKTAAATATEVAAEYWMKEAERYREATVKAQEREQKTAEELKRTKEALQHLAEHLETTTRALAQRKAAGMTSPGMSDTELQMLVTLIAAPIPPSYGALGRDRMARIARALEAELIRRGLVELSVAPLLPGARVRVSATVPSVAGKTATQGTVVAYEPNRGELCVQVRLDGVEGAEGLWWLPRAKLERIDEAPAAGGDSMPPVSLWL